ncbi:plasmid mobilization protein [Vibrio tubiashii]|uniref:Relaxosome NikA n=1 Tax=Vibrio tubiashii ATCC 19109 TaxID=1051646 RepID=F9T6S2_9VIBR|nr:plasmid mobilization relaxosome protein MobC [Vibrio tubiashii]AIW17486.1 relaxosome NikA [Vibrio tubiashii ATCC 19109]EGU54477.1 relaxosome NikA [Vibrio tubiashii ATCC 19109]EIF06000.1 relaxosome NikA [Vibrio tubiashii NCIMB 1337 = ATCC 19106]
MSTTKSTSKKDNENKDEVITFRLTAEQYAPFKKQIEDNNTNKSSFFRQLTLANQHFVVESKELPKDTARLLFLANKVSNNLNQLAKRVHQSHRADVVDKNLYIRTLNTLQDLQKLWNEAVKKC